VLPLSFFEVEPRFRFSRLSIPRALVSALQQFPAAPWVCTPQIAVGRQLYAIDRGVLEGAIRVGRPSGGSAVAG